VQTAKQFGPATTTPVFDAYWTFAAERQAVYFRRLRGQIPPWTDDAILSSFRFTNAYRASDRVSQYLIRHVIYDRDYEAVDTFFRILIFKLFNKIETWQLLQSSLGEVRVHSFSFAEYDAVLSDAMNEGRRIYSAAYMMPSANRDFGTERKHQGHLRLVERMLDQGVPDRVGQCGSMSDAFQLLLSYPTIGNFLAYQLITDLNYSPITNFSENEFVMPGPGALDGISKCFSDFGGYDQSDLIRLVADRQAEEFGSRGLDFEMLGGRPLQLIDCQNLFCEISKYSRVSHPEIAGVSGRTKIKQKFHPIEQKLTAWFPPKWGINESIDRQIEQGEV
jgi:alpha-glutamyl/putrescinyl thymine pyrophosphorylase clade 1